VADGTAICPSCDHILDSSFLSDVPPEPGTDPAAAAAGVVQRVSPRPEGRGGTRPRPPTPRGVAAAKAPVADQSTRIKNLEDLGRERAEKAPVDAQSTRIKSLDDLEAARPPPTPARERERERERERRPASVRGAVAVAATLPEEESGVVSPDQVLVDAKNFIRDLSFADKLAFLGAAGAVFFCFLPWKQTSQEGEVLGLMSLGLPAFLASIVAMVAVAVRVNRSMPNLNPVVPWLAQLGSLCAAVMWSLMFIKLSSDGTRVPALYGNQEVAISAPEFGVFAAIGCNLLAIFGTMMGLKEKPH
jgi:hypothetical protein